MPFEEPDVPGSCFHCQLPEAFRSADLMALAGMRLPPVGAIRVTTMLFATVGSAELVAIMVTVEGCGAVDGAV